MGCFTHRLFVDVCFICRSLCTNDHVLFPMGQHLQIILRSKDWNEQGILGDFTITKYIATEASITIRNTYLNCMGKW